jgi:hypothetical protein
MDEGNAMSIAQRGMFIIRATAVAGLALSVTACANEPVNGRGLGPMMMLNAPANAAEAAPAAEPSDPLHDLSKKSLAAKVLTSRALETVTGMAIDPARLSEHD